MAMNDDILRYNDTQEPQQREVCTLLAQEIQRGLPGATNKVWHGAPVWFINNNPIVGYWVRKNHIQLLFWSGQSFDEPKLLPEGSFKAAEARYTDISGIDTHDVQRWLKKAQTIQWDYKNIVNRKGRLEKIKASTDTSS